MAYKQNSPFSRNSYESPLNSFESLVAKLEKEGKSHEAATKIAGSVANAKMHGAGSGPTAKQKARHGMSRVSSSPLHADMTIVDEEEGRGESNYEATHGDKKGVSRRSSSPLNQDERSGRLKPDYSDYEEQQKRHHEKTSESVDERSGNRFPGVRDGQRDATTFITSHPNYISNEQWDNATDEQKGISRRSQGYNDRLDESLAKDGKESSKKQSMKDRRDESKGMEKSTGKGAYSSDPKMS